MSTQPRPRRRDPHAHNYHDEFDEVEASLCGWPVWVRILDLEDEDLD